MKITNVDTEYNLFRVENFYPQELLTQFTETDHLSALYKKEEMQDNWPRRKILFDTDSVYEKMDRYVKSMLDNIAGSINCPLLACDTGFWLDEPLFSMDPHLDNDGVQVSMQLYLNDNDINLGTVFYNIDKSIRYKAEYRVNTGYIMINGPSQVHGMGIPVPENTYRISSYTWMYPKV